MTLRYSLIPADDAIVEHLVDDCGLHPVIARTLATRGISSSQQATNFLNPSIEQLHDPTLLPGMAAAVERINEALLQKQKIIVHGDFDTDGLTSTVLLVQALRSMGGDVDYFIPNRLEEGYGLNHEGVERARDMGAGLIITCDCGVTSIEEVALAEQWGIDVIVTDHHEPDETLPEAIAVINPKLKGSSYPFDALAGVGVVSKLVVALMENRRTEVPITNILRITCLGTIADVVPLVDENRVIAHHGLTHLRGTKNVGLIALFKVAGLDKSEISSYDVGFRIAPRINSTGRYGKQELAMSLLFSKSRTEAAKIARKMNELNAHRQQAVDVMLGQAEDLINAQPELRNEKIIVISKIGWHKGLVGLVASKLSELYHKPTLVIAVEDGIGVGSGRSIEGFHLVDNLRECSHLFNRFGGHAMAAGFELPAAHIAELRTKMSDLARRQISDKELVKFHKVSDEVSLDQLDAHFVREYRKMEPFGYGNETPIYLVSGIEMAADPIILKDKHLKLKLKRGVNRVPITALAWNMAERKDELKPGSGLDILFSINFNSWRGREELQLSVKDFQIV